MRRGTTRQLCFFYVAHGYLKHAPPLPRPPPYGCSILQWRPYSQHLQTDLTAAPSHNSYPTPGYKQEFLSYQTSKAHSCRVNHANLQSGLNKVAMIYWADLLMQNSWWITYSRESNKRPTDCWPVCVTSCTLSLVEDLVESSFQLQVYGFFFPSNTNTVALLPPVLRKAGVWKGTSISMTATDIRHWVDYIISCSSSCKNPASPYVH